MAYVDLNPVQAKIATCLEERRLTSMHDRIRAKRARLRLEQMELDVENSVQTVERYGSIYCRVAGKVENLKRKALELGQRCVSGLGKSHWVFRRKPKGSKAGEIPVAAV